MIHLHYSNRLEELIDPLGSFVHGDQLRDPLEPVTIIVPSRAIEEFLKLRLSDREGVAANFKFPFLRGYLANIAERASSGGSKPGIKVLDAGGLQIAVFEYLRRALDKPEADLDPVRAYLDATHDEPHQRAVRMFQLSSRVAWLLREYSTSRRAMLKQWPRGTTLTDARLLESERWQRRIYLSLFDIDGSLRPEWINPAPIELSHDVRWMLLPSAFDAIDDQSLRDVVPARLHIFGLAYAGSEFIQIFGRLGARIDLHIYTLNPCREFWEDVRNRGTAHPPRLGPLFVDGAEDPFELGAGEDNLALRYWGRAGREYIRLLNELTDCDFDEHFVEPAPIGGIATLLARVQQAILTRSSGTLVDADSTASAANPDEAPAASDDSIRFLQCPGVRREIEIVADAIWSLIRYDNNKADGAAPIRFHQIAIVIPEGVRDQYLAQIESVFAGAHGIPINIVSRRFTAESRVAEAMDLLLKLPLGRFTRTEMVRLLTHPAMTGLEDEPYTQAWPELCRRLGVHFGADESAFAGTYIEPKLYHWDYALKRLALGSFMAGEGSGEMRVYRDAGGREYLPLEVTENDRERVAIMMRKARALICDARALAESELDLAGWRDVLTRLIATHLSPADRDGERVRDSIMKAIESIHTDGIRSDPVPYEVAHELAQARISEVEAERGTYAESGVVVGTLTTLRSIPFRATFILGLGEADFPAREHRDPLDLRQARRHAGDVSPAERDRYEFLEILLAARNRLFLSFVSRNPQTGEELEPSAVIRDLQLILRGMIGEEALQRLTVKHPVNAHDRRYFADLAHPGEKHDVRLETFSRNAFSGARIVALREDLEHRCEPFEDGDSERELVNQLSLTVRSQIVPLLNIIEPPAVVAVNEDSRVRLTISALRHYLECPLQGAARHALGMREDDDGDEEHADEEPIARTRLDEVMLLRDTLWQARGKGDDLDTLYNDICHRRMLAGSSPVGPFAAAISTGDIDHLEHSIEQLKRLEIPNLERWQRIAVGGVDEFSDVESVLDPIVLDVDFTRTDGRRVTSIELRGRVGPVSPRIDRAFKLIARDDVKLPDFLEGGFGAIVLAAAGAKMPREFIVMVLGGKDKKKPNNLRAIPIPTQTEARAYLTRLATDMLSGDNDYFLPIEAVEAVVKHGTIPIDSVIADAIQSVSGNERGYCRSDYGPVRYGRKYRMPVHEIKEGLIERRYGPLMTIFERGTPTK
jgi:exodeoxyribonuclease V gamma subunit